MESRYAQPPLEIEPWVDAKLRCGIGHVVSGRVRVIRKFYPDREGMTNPETGLTGSYGQAQDEYDPDRCVVCGLWITKRAE